MVSQQLIRVAFLGVFTLGALLLLAKGLHEGLIVYRIYATEPTPVADLPNVSGHVEVTGVARIHDRTVESPVTGTPCLAYMWEVESLETDSDGDTHWETIDSGSVSVPFRVEDDTGSVLVDPESADLRLEEARKRRRVENSEALPDEIRTFADSIEFVRRSVGPYGISFSDPRRYTESRLDPDEPVYIYGAPTYVPGESREAGEVNARIEGGRPFIVADGTESEATRRVLGEAVFFVSMGLFSLGFVAWFILFG